MTDYQKYINALRQCAKEHKNDTTFTGHIIVADLCQDTANLLKELSSSENPNKWIPVNEESPKENQKVLMKTKDFGTVSGVYRTIEYGSEKEGKFLTHYAIDSSAMAVVEVTEWMPLPE